MMLPSRLGCPLSRKTPNMGNTGWIAYAFPDSGIKQRGSLRQTPLDGQAGRVATVRMGRG